MPKIISEPFTENGKTLRASLVNELHKDVVKVLDSSFEVQGSKRTVWDVMHDPSFYSAEGVPVRALMDIVLETVSALRPSIRKKKSLYKTLGWMYWCIQCCQLKHASEFEDMREFSIWRAGPEDQPHLAGGPCADCRANKVAALYEVLEWTQDSYAF